MDRVSFRVPPGSRPAWANGLDSDGVSWVRGLLRDPAARGRTVLVTSRLLTELQQSADHVIVMGRRRRRIARCATANHISRARRGPVTRPVHGNVRGVTDPLTGPEPVVDGAAANQVRALNYLLDGKDNFEVDRTATDESTPDQQLLRRMARTHEQFRQRVVRHLAQDGIGQFLVLDDGFPHGTALHEVAQGIDPAARVVYVSDDPVVIAHFRALLKSGPRGVVEVVGGRADRFADLLAEPALLAVLDLDRPVGVLVASRSLTRLCDDTATVQLGVLRAALAPGSRLALSHLTADFDADRLAGTVRAMAAAGIPHPVRSRDRLTGLFAGWQLEAPGVGSILDWHPAARDSATHPDDASRPEEVHVLGGVARLV